MLVEKATVCLAYSAENKTMRNFVNSLRYLKRFDITQECSRLTNDLHHCGSLVKLCKIIL